MSWLEEGNRKPFVIVGPDGCGKEKLLKNCFQSDHNSHVVIMHCSAQTRFFFKLSNKKLF